MTPAEATTILRQFIERCVDCQFDDPRRVMEAIDAAVEMIESMESALRLIAETDPIDAALDPQRAVRIARAALEESK